MQYGCRTGEDERKKNKKKYTERKAKQSKENSPSVPYRPSVSGRIDSLADPRPLRHLCTAVSTQYQRSRSRDIKKHTVHALPVFLRVAVKQRVLVSRLHLGLRRHLPLPPLHRRRDHALLCERVVDARHDAVDAPQPLSVSVLLHAGHAPGDFPAAVGQRGGQPAAGGGLPEETAVQRL